MTFIYPYPRPAVTVDALVFAPAGHEWFILLVQRGKEPFQCLWALPGGFMDLQETLLEACMRELQEETGLVIEKMEPFRVYDALDRDPRHRTISVVFSAYLPEIVPVRGDDDASRAEWFRIDQLPELAFDHTEIVSQFLKLYF